MDEFALTDMIIGGSGSNNYANIRASNGGAGHNSKGGDDVIIVKDSVIASLIPDEISECALYLKRPKGVPCSSPGVVKIIGASINVREQDPIKIMLLAKQTLGCDTELCVLNKMSGRVNPGIISNEISTNFKVQGHTDNRLLSNFNIDTVLRQWAKGMPDFYPYNFNMLNYASHSYRDSHVENYPDSLATVKFGDLYASGIRTAACIINSDIYQGMGKHWMALFADARKTPATIEFFNSSGNSPAPEWINWMKKTQIALELLGHTAKIVKVAGIKHQNSRSECGPYSMFYIWARLNNVPLDYFLTNKIDDSLMFEFRQHLFNDPSRESLKHFDWNEYKKTVNIKWE